jgi:type IV secretion system protein VirD4
MDDPSRPPPIHGSSAEGWLAWLAGLLALLATLDLAGALSALVSGGRYHLVSSKAMGAAIGGLLRHPGNPATAFGSRAHFGAAIYWPVVALLVLAGVVLVVVALRLSGRLGASAHQRGFATPAAVEKTAGLQAARRRARQTRPSLLAAEAPSRRGPGGSRLLARDVGYPLGVTRVPKGISLVASWEVSLRVVAPPGEGKTTRVMEPIGAQHPGALFATSTKSDLYEAIVGERSLVGDAFALDPDGLVPGARPVRWSPVSGCASTRTADRRAGALIAAGADTGDVRSGEFFRASARAVLATLLHAAALSGASMREVVAWAADPGNPEPMQILAKHGEGRVSWSERLARHTRGSEVTTSGVMRTVDLALSCFAHDEVLELCSPAKGEEFDFEKLFEKTRSVFALGKDRPGGVAPLVTAFAEELVFVAEERAARAPSRRLDPPLLCLLDEVAGIAPLPGLPGLVADGRGRGIVVVYALQSFSQAEARWGAHGARTLGNATSATCVLGGLKVAEDLAELSRICGSRKVLRHSSSADERGSASSVSASWVDEPLLDESAIRCLDEGVALVLWGRLAPMLVYLPGSWETERASKAAASERAARSASDTARAATASP